MLELNTFSIAARCERTGMLGVAVSTAVPGVGGICPFIIWVLVKKPAMPRTLKAASPATRSASAASAF